MSTLGSEAMLISSVGDGVGLTIVSFVGVGAVGFCAFVGLTYFLGFDSWKVTMKIICSVVPFQFLRANCRS